MRALRNDPKTQGKLAIFILQFVENGQPCGNVNRQKGVNWWKWTRRHPSKVRLFSFWSLCVTPSSGEWGDPSRVEGRETLVPVMYFRGVQYSKYKNQ